MARNTTFEVGEFYHIYNRGIEGRQIFMDEHDYARAKLLLFLANSEYRVDIDNEFKKGLTFLDLWEIDRGEKRVDIGGWCLMPNHYHFIVRETTEGGISSFMKVFATAYSMYFNARYERSGSLMQGSYKSSHLSDDRYLQYLFSYVHLNPIKLIGTEKSWKTGGIHNLRTTKEFLDGFEHSSLIDYGSNNERVERNIINPDIFPWKFKSLAAMQDDAVEWLQKG